MSNLSEEEVNSIKWSASAFFGGKQSLQCFYRN